MRTVRAPTVLASLRQAARERSLIDYEATRRARARQEQFLLFADWQPLSLQNGWQQYTAFGETVPPAVFRDQWGFVHVRGHVMHSSALSKAPIVTLPLELRPAAYPYFPAAARLYDGAINAFVLGAALIRAAPNGDVQVSYYRDTNYSYEGDTAHEVSVGMLSLDAIVIRPANAGGTA